MAEVGKVKISNLPLASSVSDNDAMLIVQNGSAKRVMPSLMKGKQGDKGDDGKTGQGFAYKWDGTSLVLGTIAVGSSTIKWGEGVNLKGEQGDEGLKGAGSHVEQNGTKVRFGRSAVGQTSVTWGEYVQLRGSDAIYQWDGTSLKMGTRTYTVDGSTEEYSAGVDLKGATGQGMAYRWVGTKLQLGTIPVGGGEVSWITGIDLKGEQGLRGVHGTDLEYVWEGTSLKLGRIRYSEDGTMTLVYSDPVNLQGNRGEQGLQPAMQMGDVTTLNPEETASATFVKDGTTADGADIYKLNLSIPRGMAGKEGMPRIPSAVLSLTSASTSDEIFAAWGGKDAMLAVGTSFLAGEKSNCLMSGNATLYFAYTDADNFQLDMLFRLKGKENQYEHWVVDGEATLTVTTYDNVHVNNASTMVKGKQYAFEPDTDGSASGVMKEVAVITQEEKDKINSVYSKSEIDSTFAKQANVYTKDETYTKQEVENKIPTLVDAYSKTESDERYPQKGDVIKTLPESAVKLMMKYINNESNQTVTDEDYNTFLSYAPDGRNSYLVEVGDHGITKYNVVNNSNEIYVDWIFEVETTTYLYEIVIQKETKSVLSGGFITSMAPAEEGIGLMTFYRSTDGTSEQATISLKTKGTGSQFLSDDGTYKEIDTSSLAAKSEVSQYLNMPDELLSAIFNTTGKTATDENYATIVKYVPAGESKVFLGNMISLGLSGSGKFAITNNGEVIVITIDYQDSVSNQSTKSMIGINHSDKAVAFLKIINSISVKDSGLTIYGNKRNTDGTSSSKTIDLITNGTGSKYLSDDGSYKEIESRLPYFFNPSVLNGMSTSTSYPASEITGQLGMTLREFVANYGERIVFKEYMGALAYSQDSAGTLAEFTYYTNNKIRVVKIIHEDADTTCNVTVTEKQLVTNILAMSESNYANLSSKDSSTLYLVY